MLRRSAGNAQPGERAPNQVDVIARFISGAVPFRDFSPAQMRSVATAMHSISSTRGQLIVREGSTGAHFFVVVRGEYGVYQKGAPVQGGASAPVSGCVSGAVSLGGVLLDCAKCTATLC